MHSEANRPTGGLEVQLEDVTPEMAKQYLETNTHNRPVSRPYVRDLAKELEEGRWVLTHQGISFDHNGVLVDGQHRLMAIMISGVAAQMLVTRGADPESFHAIDQHRRRTAGQILTMGGVTKDAPRVAAMARAIMQVVYGHHHVTNTAASAYALEHRSTLELYLPVSRKYTPAVGAAFAWATDIGWHEALDAAVRLVEKLWDSPEDPMRALDRRAEDFKKLGQGQAGIKTRFDIALNCLQSVHENKPLKVARSVRPDYAAIERQSMRPGLRASSPARQSQIEYEADWHREPPVAASGLPGALVEPEDAELDEIIREQVARNRPTHYGEASAVAFDSKSEGDVLGDGGEGPTEFGVEPTSEVGRNRRSRRSITAAQRDAALDEAVRSANGR